jgi:hypothetical protein
MCYMMMFVRRADVSFVVNVRLHVAVIGRTRVPSSSGVGVALRSSLVWIVLAVIVRRSVVIGVDVLAVNSRSAIVVVSDVYECVGCHSPMCFVVMCGCVGRHSPTCFVVMCGCVGRHSPTCFVVSDMEHIRLSPPTVLPSLSRNLEKGRRSAQARSRAAS